MPSLLKLLRKRPVGNTIEEVTTFINRELVPFLGELVGSTNQNNGDTDTDLTALEDAPYVTYAASSSLSNERVATDSTEINVDTSVANAISWAINTASVVLAKLQNLDGLSVLGRATNSSGVMAAITATDANQKLVSNPAGTSVTWVSDLPAAYADTVSGTLTDYALPSGFRSGDTLRLTLTADVTLNSIVENGGAAPPDGFEMNLCLSDQSGGSAPGWALTIPDGGTSSASAAFRTPGQVQGTVPGPSYVMQSEEEGARLAYQTGAWRIISGTAAQAITGDVVVSAGNGSTRTAAIGTGVIVNADVNGSAAIAQTKLGAFTGFAAKASGASTTSSAEPIVTYSASSNMSAERVTTASTSITINTGVASQIAFERAALTGVITASQNSNTTVFGSPAPVSITGTTEQEQIDSIISALVALGLATDDR